MSSNLVPIALTVLADEPAFSLSELNLQSGKGWHRYQVIVVVRADKLARYQEDMGPSTTDTEFRLIGGFMMGDKIEIVHTVAELRDMAAQLHDRPFDTLQTVEPRPLKQEYADLVQERWDWRKRLAVSGKYISRSV